MLMSQALLIIIVIVNLCTCFVIRDVDLVGELNSVKSVSTGLVLGFPALKEAFDLQDSARSCNLYPRSVPLLLWILDRLSRKF